MKVDKLDDLLLLLLRSDGKQSAIASYEEETGANHSEGAVDKKNRRVKQNRSN